MDIGQREQFGTRGAVASPAAEPVEITWQHPRGLWGLSLLNALLRIVTFNVYTYWGKAEVRNRIWSGVRINGEPLAYHGTGLELFLGFLVALPFIAVPFGLLYAAQIYGGPDIKAVVGVALVFYYVVLAWLYSVAIYRARRYRLTRTSWRGIRGNMAGSPGYYAWTSLWTAVLIPLSLYWAIPWRQTKLQRIMVENTRFGSEQLQFTGKSGGLYGVFAAVWLGNIAAILIAAALAALVQALIYGFSPAAFQPAPGPRADQTKMIVFGVLIYVFWILIASLLLAWYQAFTFNYFTNNTKIAGASFKGSAGPFGFIWLNIGNLVVALLPGLLFAALGAAVIYYGLGIQSFQELAANGYARNGWFLLVAFGVTIFLPIIQARSARYWMRHLHLEGAVPLAQIAQNAQVGSGLGEGLAEAFDIDVF